MRAADRTGIALDALRAEQAAFLQAVLALIEQQPVSEAARKYVRGYAVDMAADLFHDEIERLEEESGDAYRISSPDNIVAALLGRSAA